MLSLSALLAMGALVVGPALMLLLFGEGFDVEAGDLAILAAGVGTYLAAATLGQAAMARDQGGRAAMSWLLAAVVFVTVELALPGAPFHRVSVAFTAATAVACVMLAFLVLRSSRRSN
jgi:O-antigen/teichoic acid export membrane protein